MTATEASAEMVSSETNGGTLVNDNCIGLALRRATRRVTRLYDEALAEHKITIGQLGILAMVHAKTGKVHRPSVQELADEFEMNQSAMSRTLKPLIREGMLEDMPCREDRRRRLIGLTTRGRVKLEAASPSWARVQAELISDQKGTLANLLAAVGDER